MKSTGQTPITHPTPKKLRSLLDDTIEEVNRVGYCVVMLEWGATGKHDSPMHVHVPVPTHADSAWLLADYELTTDKDFQDVCVRIFKTMTKVRNMEAEREWMREKGRTRKKKSV
jgi:hypothetical protein